MGAHEEGMNIYKRVDENVFSYNAIILISLVDMYEKCQKIQNAHTLFDKMHGANTISWSVNHANTKIIAYLKESNTFIVALVFFSSSLITPMF